MPVLSGHWCHACAHRGRAAEGPRRPFLFPPSTVSFFQDECIFQKPQPIVSHNRQRLSQFYAAFPVWGGSLSAGIEDYCDAARTTRGCPSNTLWLQEKGMKGKKEAYSHTQHTNTQHPLTANKDGVWLERLANERLHYIFTSPQKILFRRRKRRKCSEKLSRMLWNRASWCLCCIINELLSHTLLDSTTLSSTSCSYIIFNKFASLTGCIVILIQILWIYMITQIKMEMGIQVSHWALGGHDSCSHDWIITIYCEVKTTGAGPSSGYIRPLRASKPLAMQWEEMDSHVLAA